MNSTSRLNLARKWRPQSFNDVAGQEVTMSMLRNSLYKNHLFPVYLFAGQKGCGKTSSARIFAAAVNCEKLPQFQKNAAGQVVPCQNCTACQTMKNGSFPDFIEIDAASHTGVDDVRALLESCSFMPLAGTHKIYLIDEAHMLSRAAFNALLKILEEPPQTVIFMLATTEYTKIPETVRSRCFQLHFSALSPEALTAYLQKICDAEQIAYEKEGLALLVQQTDGSARDAVNLLEQVRFTGTTITVEQVRQALGILNGTDLAQLLALMLENNAPAMLSLLAEKGISSLGAAHIWDLFLALCRAVLLWHYKVEDPLLMQLPEQVRQRLVTGASRNRLHAIMQLLWQQEEIFLATPHKYQFLEYLFLQICTQVNSKDLEELKVLIATNGATSASTRPTQNAQPVPAAIRQASAPIPAPAEKPIAKVEVPVVKNADLPQGWATFLSSVTALGDPILASIFSQATPGQQTTPGKLSLALAHKNSFIMDKLVETKPQWLPLFTTAMHPHTDIHFVEGAVSAPQKPRPAPVSAPIRERQPQPAPAKEMPQGRGSDRYAAKQPTFSQPLPQGTPLALSEQTAEKWPVAHLLVSHFPGKLELLPSTETAPSVPELSQPAEDEEES